MSATVGYIMGAGGEVVPNPLINETIELRFNSLLLKANEPDLYPDGVQELLEFIDTLDLTQVDPQTLKSINYAKHRFRFVEH